MSVVRREVPRMGQGRAVQLQPQFPHRMSHVARHIVDCAPVPHVRRNQHVRQQQQTSASTCSAVTSVSIRLLIRCQDAGRSRSAVGQKSRDRSTAEVYQERVNQLVIPQEKSKLELLHMIQNGEDVTQVRSHNHRHSFRAPTVDRNPGMLAGQSKVRSGLSDEEARELFKRRKK